jgi:deoxyribodipyrimidine photolyase-related protein
MVPNIFGMSQYSDGGLIMTRPYFSSSNYINKMSNYKKGDWIDIWNALYYNFIDKHQLILKKNYAISNQVNNWLKKTNKEKDEIKKIASEYIHKLIK